MSCRLTLPYFVRPALAVILAIVSLTGPVRAVPVAPQRADLQFRDSDRVCFVGDSITAGGVYSSFVAIFYATRYPERNMEFFNCGRSGGSARGCLDRLSWDILDHHPTTATVSFGMNDMSRLHLGISQTQEALEPAVTERIATVEANYIQLLEGLAVVGPRITLIGPSPYDDTLQVETKIERSNFAMSRWTARLKEIAAQRGVGFVDLGAAMNPVNARLQAVDPAASIVGKDRVHPATAGHLLMAYTILKAQGVEPDVARICIEAKTGKAGALKGCTVEDIRSNAAGVEFVCREQALPFVIPQEGGMQGASFWGIAGKAAAQIEEAGGAPLIPFQTELNREILCVTGLPSGSYEVRIDGVVIGTYDAALLATGVNLAENSKTPQYAQALALAKSIEALRVLETSFFRLIAYVRHSILTPAKVPFEDTAAVEACLKEAVEKLAPDNYSRGMAQRYLQSVPGKKELKEQERANLLASIRAQKVTQLHRFSIQRISEPAIK